MSKDKKVYTSQSVQKANRKFMMSRHAIAPPKPIRKKPLTVNQPKVVHKPVDQTTIGDEQ